MLMRAFPCSGAVFARPLVIHGWLNASRLAGRARRGARAGASAPPDLLRQCLPGRAGGASGDIIVSASNGVGRAGRRPRKYRRHFYGLTEVIGGGLGALSSKGVSMAMFTAAG